MIHLRTTLTRILRVAGLLSLITFAGIAGAQVRVLSGNQVVFPGGLSWQLMDRVKIRHDSKPNTGSAKDIADLTHIWQNEVNTQATAPTMAELPILIGRTVSRGKPVIVSVIHLNDYDRCEPPLNGRDVVDMYSKCIAKVVTPSQSTEINRFCFLAIDPDDDAPLKSNNNQLATDPKTGVIYFRLIQQGKLIPACNRAIYLN